jgi:predicted dehydrogenase
VLKTGKHVFIEKPLALNLPDCERVLVVATEHPAQVAVVGFVRRVDSSYRNAAAAVEAGEIGRPFLVRSQTCGAKAVFYASRTLAHGHETTTEGIGTASTRCSVISTSGSRQRSSRPAAVSSR